MGMSFSGKFGSSKFVSVRRLGGADGFCSLGVKGKKGDKKVCCAKDECEEMCGGDGCGRRPGGSEKCCTGTIASTNRPCSSATDVGCVYSDSNVVPVPSPTPMAPDVSS